MVKNYVEVAVPAVPIHFKAKACVAVVLAGTAAEGDAWDLAVEVEDHLLWPVSSVGPDNTLGSTTAAGAETLETVVLKAAPRIRAHAHAHAHASRHRWRHRRGTAKERTSIQYNASIDIALGRE